VRLPIDERHRKSGSHGGTNHTSIKAKVYDGEVNFKREKTGERKGFLLEGERGGKKNKVGRSFSNLLRGVMLLKEEGGEGKGTTILSSSHQG